MASQFVVAVAEYAANSLGGLRGLLGWDRDPAVGRRTEGGSFPFSSPPFARTKSVLHLLQIKSTSAAPIQAFCGFLHPVQDHFFRFDLPVPLGLARCVGTRLKSSRFAGTRTLLFLSRAMNGPFGSYV